MSPILIGFYVVAAVTNLILFATEGNWDKLIIGALFIVIAANTSTIDKWKHIARSTAPSLESTD